jgi:hypothetical protein
MPIRTNRIALEVYREKDTRFYNLGGSNARL